MCCKAANAIASFLTCLQHSCGTCRARLAFAARSYLATGVVPSVMLANHHEPLLPWGPYGQVSSQCTYAEITVCSVSNAHTACHTYMSSFVSVLQYLIASCLFSMICLLFCDCGITLQYTCIIVYVPSGGCWLLALQAARWKLVIHKVRTLVANGLCMLQGRVVLGARVEDACLGPSEYANALETFGTAAYALTYRPETDKAYVILRQGATVQDTLCGAFHAHVLLHMLDAAQDKPALPALQLLPKAEPGTNIQSLMSGLRGVGDIDEPHEHLLHVTATKGYQLYQDFVRKASNLGWNLDSTMLNPQESRLIAAERA